MHHLHRHPSGGLNRNRQRGPSVPEAVPLRRPEGHRPHMKNQSITALLQQRTAVPSALSRPFRFLSSTPFSGCILRSCPPPVWRGICCFWQPSHRGMQMPPDLPLPPKPERGAHIGAPDPMDRPALLFPCRRPGERDGRHVFPLASRPCCAGWKTGYPLLGPLLAERVFLHPVEKRALTSKGICFIIFL